MIGRRIPPQPADLLLPHRRTHCTFPPHRPSQPRTEWHWHSASLRITAQLRSCNIPNPSRGASQFSVIAWPFPSLRLSSASAFSFLPTAARTRKTATCEYICPCMCPGRDKKTLNSKEKEEKKPPKIPVPRARACCTGTASPPLDRQSRWVGMRRPVLPAACPMQSIGCEGHSLPPSQENYGHCMPHSTAQRSISISIGHPIP